VRRETDGCDAGYSDRSPRRNREIEVLKTHDVHFRDPHLRTLREYITSESLACDLCEIRIPVCDGLRESLDHHRPLLAPIIDNDVLVTPTQLQAITHSNALRARFGLIWLVMLFGPGHGSMHIIETWLDPSMASMKTRERDRLARPSLFS
jgi:hypothetical protein